MEIKKRREGGRKGGRMDGWMDGWKKKTGINGKRSEKAERKEGKGKKAQTVKTENKAVQVTKN